MNKTKVITSGERRQKERQKAVRWPCGVCSKGQNPNWLEQVRAVGTTAYQYKDVSLIMRGRLYSSCVRNSMLHGSETWPVRKENVVALQRAEMRMVRWICGIKLKNRFRSKELRERLGIDDIALVLQQNRLHWYGHVL